MAPKKPYRKSAKRKGSAGRWALASVALLLAGMATAFGLAQWIQGAARAPASSTASGDAPAVSSQPATPPPASAAPAAEPEKLTVSVSAVGDNLVHDGLYIQARERAGGAGYDFTYCFEEVKYFFERFDANWINQESLLNNAYPADGYPFFSTPVEMGHAAYNAGWRVFSISNNHTYDLGAAGIASTLEFWRGMPEDTVYTGLFTNKEDDSGIKLQQVNGMTIAWLSYTDHTNYVANPVDPEAEVVYSSELDVIQRQVQRAGELADAVVVGVHWEQENSHAVIQSQRTLAAHLADWGADIVIGTHPHVIQPIEMVAGSETGRTIPVAFSLGNFLSGQAQANQLVGLCLAFELTQTVQPDGTRGEVAVENLRAYPTVTHYDAGYANGRVYMARDYTDELAAKHGVQARYPGFNLSYVRELCETYVDKQYLVFD